MYWYVFLSTWNKNIIIIIIIIIIYLCFLFPRVLIFCHYFYHALDTQEQSTSSAQQSSFDDDPYQAHKMWLSVGVASAAMAGYAILNGLIKINRKHDVHIDDTDDVDYSLDNE